MGAIVLCLFLFSCLMLSCSFFRRNRAEKVPPRLMAEARRPNEKVPPRLMAEARRPNGYPVSYEGAESARPNGYPVSNEITSTLNEITVALTQPNFFILGVYGSSNAKKDIVVAKITRRVMRDNLFDLIVRASVMKKPDLKRIQGELGNMLGLQIREKTLEGRARLLNDKIKTTSRILIILDDVWGQINFSRIGIPYGNNHNNHNGYKILLISETQNVLSNQTNAQIPFIV